MRKTARFLVALLLPLLVWAATAGAALTQKGNLFIRFDGGISPKTLPRHSPVPISVRVEGTIRQIGGEGPPALEHIEIALNRAGLLETTGLPVCKQNRIRGETTAEAIATCGPALVGTGGYTVRTSLPNQEPTVSPGEVLLFNSRAHGHAAILAHVFQSEPIPVGRVFVFKIKHGHGAYGNVVSADIPAALSSHGSLRSIYLQLQRRYTYRGVQRSYLSASCSAPAGFNQALFPFAHASMSFDDGSVLSSTISRTCHTR